MNIEEYMRYARHLVMPEIGEKGQNRLRDAKVLVVGCGGLGAPVSLYLAAAGIGEIGLIDGDVVDLSNLQRQVLYKTSDVGQKKAEIAKQRLIDLNPNCKVTSYNCMLNNTNIREIFENYDYIVDATDNFSARYLISDACVIFNKIHIYGAVFRFVGQVSVFDSRKGATYRTVFPVKPKQGQIVDSSEAGVLGVLPDFIGVIQATETIKLILGIGECLINKLLIVDLLSMNIQINTVCYEATNEFIPDGSFSHPDYEYNNKALKEISYDDFISKRDSEKTLFLNVGLRNEIPSELHNSNTLHIPLESFYENMHLLNKYKNNEIIVFCRHGIGSRRVADSLKIREFDVAWLKNGLIGQIK